MSILSYLDGRVRRKLDGFDQSWRVEDAHYVRDVLRFVDRVGRALDYAGTPAGWDEVAERYRELRSDQP